MPIFETNALNDPLDLWDTSPQPVSFALGDETPAPPQPAVPVYSVNLPSGWEASTQALAERESRFAGLDSALDSVPARLDGLVSHLQAAQPEAGGSVSFAVPVSEAGSTPEGELLALLAESAPEARSDESSGEVSFGLNEPVSEAYREAKSRFEAFLEQVNHEILHFAWVETKIADQLIARSEVDWSGDATTLWSAVVSAEQMALHQRTLNIATQTRNLKLRLLVTVAGGAAKVTALMAAGTPVLALPAIYQYVMSILKQVRQLQSITQVGHSV